MEIKEILDKYNVQYGDIFYSKKSNKYYMIAIETELYGNPHIIDFDTGIVYVDSWSKNGEESMLHFFEDSDVELVDKSLLMKKIKLWRVKKDED